MPPGGGSSGSGVYFAPSGLPGATAASRYVGGTASGAPASGTFLVGDYAIDESGAIWICTVAGSPGTWTQVGGGSAGPWTNYTTTVVGTTSNTLTRARYFLIGKLCHLAFELEGTGSTTAYSMTLPFNCGGVIDFYDHFHARDNSVYMNGMSEIATGAPTLLTFYTSDSFGAWTASGDRRAWGEIFYETV
jgi:hypothetical protein